MMKYFCDVVPCLGGCLEESKSVLLCKLPTSFGFDHLVWLVAFVGHKDLGDIGSSMLLNLLKPVLDVIEGLHVGAVINENDAHRSFVVGLGDGSESFLTCCVPHLQLHPFIIHVYFLDLKVDAYVSP